MKKKPKRPRSKRRKLDPDAIIKTAAAIQKGKRR